MTATDYLTTIGTITGSGKIHLAHGRPERQRILCRVGTTETTTHTIAETPENADVCDILRAHEIPVARLCKNCFSVGLRKRYTTTALAAVRP